MKALGLVVSEKKIFEKCILKTYFLPRDLLMQPTGIVWTTLVEKHLGIIPVKCGQNPKMAKVFSKTIVDLLIIKKHIEKDMLIWTMAYFVTCSKRKKRSCREKGCLKVQ